MISEQERTHCRGRVRSTALRRFVATLGAAPLVAAVTLVVSAGPATPAFAEEPGPKEAFKIADERITESSGLTFGTKHPDTLYTMNDSGGDAEIFELDATGKTVGTVVLGGAETEDWEALSSGPEGRLWVGDIGDNERSRDSVTVYRFHEPEALGDSREQWSRFQLQYDDGPHDAETLLVHPKTGRIYVVTKDPEGGGIYAGPEELVSGTETSNTLTRVGDAPAVVTDGAFLPDASAVVLRTYGQAYVLDWPDAKVSREVGLPRQRQGESLAVSADGAQLFAGSEGANSAVFTVSVNGPPPGAGATKPGSPSPTQRNTPEKEQPAEDPAETGSSTSMKDLLGGLPWWIPALVLAVAALAGFAAFRRPRTRRSTGRAPRQPHDLEPALVGHSDDMALSDRFRYDAAQGPGDEPPWAGEAGAAPAGHWNAEAGPPGAPWDDAGSDQDRDWAPDPRYGAGAAGFAEQPGGYAEPDLPYSDEPPPFTDRRPAYDDQGPGPADPYGAAGPASPYADTVRADPYREPTDAVPPYAEMPGPYARNEARQDGPPAVPPAWDDAGWEPAAGPSDRPPWADDPGSHDPVGGRPGPEDLRRPDLGPRDLPPRDLAPRDLAPRDLGPPDLGPAGVGPVGGLRPGDLGPGDYGRDDGVRDDFGRPDFGPQDFRPPEFGRDDFVPRDAGPRDAGPQDFGPRDAGPRDAGPRDAGPQDFGPPDLGPPDFGRDQGEDFGPPEFPRRDPAAVRQPPPWEPEQPPTLPWRQPSGPPPQRGGRRRASPDDLDQPRPPQLGPDHAGDPDLHWPDVHEGGAEMPDVPPRRRSWHDEFESPPRPRRLYRDDDPAD